MHAAIRPSWCTAGTSLTVMVKIECERDESWFINVAPTDLLFLPTWICHNDTTNSKPLPITQQRETLMAQRKFNRNDSEVNTQSRLFSAQCITLCFTESEVMLSPWVSSKIADEPFNKSNFTRSIASGLTWIRLNPLQSIEVFLI